MASSLALPQRLLLEQRPSLPSGGGRISCRADDTADHRHNGAALSGGERTFAAGGLNPPTNFATIRAARQSQDQLSFAKATYEAYHLRSQLIDRVRGMVHRKRCQNPTPLPPPGLARS